MSVKTKNRSPRVRSCVSPEGWRIISSLPHMVLSAKATMRALGFHRPGEWSRDDKACRDEAIGLIARWNRHEKTGQDDDDG